MIDRVTIAIFMGVVTPRGAFTKSLLPYIIKVGERMGRRPKNYVPPGDEINITCTCCGNEKHEKEFYSNRWSKVFVANKRKVPICKDCIQKLFEKYTTCFGEGVALSIICANLDMPFYQKLYTDTLNKNSYFTLGLYIRQLQMNQYNNCTFQNTITDEKFLKLSDSSGGTENSKWNEEDEQNMNYVISTVGYDPFDDCGMSENDRKYCYNLLSGYCDIDGIKDDGHKMACCIQIVQNQLQIKKLDEEINKEFGEGMFDEDKVKKLANSKKLLQDGVAKIAQDNNISSKYNDGSKRGKNTLSQKMKDMLSDGYESVRVNLFDIKTSEAIKQVADISNKSILEQLGFDGNDYADMVKKQRELLTELQNKCDEMEEENRNLKNELNDLKKHKKR